MTGHHGATGNSPDAWIVKLNSTGGIMWQRSLGGISDGDNIKSISQAADGGFILGGGTSSVNGDIPADQVKGNRDAWIVKLDTSGMIEWQYLLGGSGSDGISATEQTTDGGYVFAGYTNSADGDVTITGPGGADYWIVKLDVISGIKEVWNNRTAALDIFPNPARQKVFLKTATEEPVLEIRIFDQAGQQMITQTVRNNESADIATLPDGVYSIIATAPSGKVYAGKIYKQD